jgi:hypothetical protein
MNEKDLEFIELHLLEILRARQGWRAVGIKKEGDAIGLAISEKVFKEDFAQRRKYILWLEAIEEE